MRRTFTRNNVMDMLRTYTQIPKRTRFPIAVLTTFSLIGMLGLVGAIKLTVFESPKYVLSIVIFGSIVYSSALGAAGILGHTPLPRTYHSEKRNYYNY